MIKYIFMLILYLINYNDRMFNKMNDYENEYRLKIGCPLKFKPIKL